MQRQTRCGIVCLIITLVIVALANAPHSAAQGDPPPVSQPLRGADLIAKAQTDGSVKVLVYLNARFVPEGSLVTPGRETVATSPAVREQRAAIATVRADVLSQLAGYNVTVGDSWTSVPGFAAVVDAAALQVLLNSPLVQDVYEDVPEPPLMGYTLPNIGVSNPGGAWDLGVDGTGFAVGVLDTGIFGGHEFLTGKVVYEACFSNFYGTDISLCAGGAQQDFGTGAANPFSACVGIAGASRCSHGTHTAGTVAGNWNTYNRSSLANGPIDMGGVARGADLIALQVFSLIGGQVLSHSADQISALEHIYTDVASVGARTGGGPYYDVAALNVSIGGGRYDTICDGSDPLRQAALLNLRSVGIATLISSGNDGYVDALNRPACLSAAVSIGATDTGVWMDGYPNWFMTGAYPDSNNGYFADPPAQERVAFFTDSAPFLDLLAPGYFVESSTLGSTSAETTEYAAGAGTSSAAPHAAGAWAILKQQSPVAPVDRILSTLQATGVTITDTPYTGNFDPGTGPVSMSFRTGANAIYPRIQVDAAVLAYGRDFGDAPASYGTLDADDGARHIRVPEYSLGVGSDQEPDGTPGIDDGDDGVVFPAMAAGETSRINVAASVEQSALAPDTPYLGLLSVWIDLNGDGDFADADEQVLTDRVLTGPYPESVPISIPASAVPGDTWARVRYGTQTGLAFDGEAYNGEVEDYPVTLLPARESDEQDTDETDTSGGGTAAGQSLDMAITKSGSVSGGGLGMVGDRLTWDVIVTNPSGVTAVNIVVMDTVRSELRIDSVEVSRGSFTVAGQTVTFTIDSLAPGESAILRINTTVLRGAADGVIDNTVILAATGPSGETVTRSATASVQIVSSLPATGYPPAGDSARGNWIWMLLVGWMGLVVVVGVVHWRLQRTA
ncbi:MAG: S8 family serine peptidase [Anaerolineae bacterium]|nr:S8 family serine peptidase [Anaerolineae bacterium]